MSETHSPGLDRFVDDDEGYLQWLRENPAGFVVNSSRDPTSGDWVLHRATCYWISHLLPSATNYTRAYGKTCSSDRRLLERWAVDRLRREKPRGCKLCHPYDD